jgi:hypothetical protein
VPGWPTSSIKVGLGIPPPAKVSNPLIHVFTRSIVTYLPS